MKSLRQALLHVLGPLTLGALVYFALRAPEIRLFDWAHALGLDAVIALLRAESAALGSQVPRAITGSVPDFAWAYGFGASLGLVWANRRGRGASAWLLFGFCVTLSVEIGQAFRLIEGVFDWIDLIAMAGGYWLGVFVLRRSGPSASPSAAPACYAVRERAR
jgi:hypothetical protein